MIDYGNRDEEDRMDRLYAELERPATPKVQRPKFEVSRRDDPKTEDLRGFLLRIHNDERLASFLKDRRYIAPLYDPRPNEESAYYLGWREQDGKIQFVYEQATWGMMLRQGGNNSNFELHEGRFYARTREIVDLFPELTADDLEDCVRKAIKEEKRVRSDIETNRF